MYLVYFGVSDFKDYRYVGFFNMWTPALLIRDPEIVKEVLVKQFNSYENWLQVENNVDPILALNPFLIYGSKWKSVRSVLTSQFTSAKMKQMVPNINVVNNKMIEHITQEMEKSKSLNVRMLTTRFTGDNVMLNAFGLNGRSFETDVTDSSKIAEQISSNSKIIQIKQTLAILFPYLRKLFKITFIGDPVPELFKNIILDAVKYRQENQIVRKDYLGYLSEMKEKLLPYYTTNDELIAHAFTFFFDGYETSALTMGYALYELTQNQDIQDKAREQIMEVLDKHNNTLTYEALQKIEYIECIVLETLRKNSIIKIMSRICLEDVEFPCASEKIHDQTLVIKKGTEIFISVESIHMDEKNYPNPKVFDPDRFKEDAKNSRHKYAFLGFGEGPKICLGRNFALTQIKMGLIAILSKFKLVLNDKTKLPLEQENLHFFTAPKSDVWIDFIPRS
ncbi:hypothetical protein FQR65_LT08853 [Abscondita terminalis]|nr:hypothetical protein FQR65_LT08853 [Abscondita terminalis]